MEKILGRKQKIRNEDWVSAYSRIEELVTMEELTQLVEATIEDIRGNVAGKNTAFAWSGGKDSLVLERLCHMAGVKECFLVICDLEYPVFQRWVTDHMPEKLEIINTGQNLELLTQSIFTNGWTLPIVIRPDGTIIDGFHRWTVAGPDWKYVPTSEKDDRRTLYERLGGKVLVVTVDHKDRAGNIYGTVTHNRARGTHLLEPMKKIVKELTNEGKTINEIGRQLGMRPEEIFRLSDFTREDFLKMMTKNASGYSKAEYITKI